MVSSHTTPRSEGKAKPDEPQLCEVVKKGNPNSSTPKLIHVEYIFSHIHNKEIILEFSFS